MRMKKIRFDGETVELAWETEVGETAVESTLKSQDEPLPEFKAALDALRPFIPKVLGVPAKVIDDTVIVTTVSISQIPKTDRLGYSISAKKPVPGSNGPWNINVPLIVEPAEETGEHEYRADLFAALGAVVEEGQRYLQGHRAQVELFTAGNGRRAAPEATPIEQEAAAADARDLEGTSPELSAAN